jgi:hypothetical protein
MPVEKLSSQQMTAIFPNSQRMGTAPREQQMFQGTMLPTPFSEEKETPTSLWDAIK